MCLLAKLTVSYTQYEQCWALQKHFLGLRMEPIDKSSIYTAHPGSIASYWASRISACWPQFPQIGAATTAASANIEDSIIGIPERWNSTAFLQYICTSRQQLASFTKCIAAYHLKQRITMETKLYVIRPLAIYHYNLYNNCTSIYVTRFAKNRHNSAFFEIYIFTPWCSMQ